MCELNQSSIIAHSYQLIFALTTFNDTMWEQKPNVQVIPFIQWTMCVLQVIWSLMMSMMLHINQRILLMSNDTCINFFKVIHRSVILTHIVFIMYQIKLPEFIWFWNSVHKTEIVFFYFFFCCVLFLKHEKHTFLIDKLQF